MEEKRIEVGCKISESKTYKVQIYCMSMGYSPVTGMGTSHYYTIAFVKVEGIPYQVNWSDSTSPQWEIQDVGHVCVREAWNQEFTKSVNKYNELFGESNWETVWLKKGAADIEEFKEINNYQDS